MNKEFRYYGITPNGKVIQGRVTASSKSKAKKLIGDVSKKYNLEIRNILPKRTFLYKVKLPNGKKLKGKQSAFSKEEVAQALAKIGYQNARIEPALFEFKTKPSSSQIMMFINMSTFLLKEKMSYDKILRMLTEEESNPRLKETLKEIERDLKRGEEGTEVFLRYQNIFGRFPAYMLGLATKSGNMAQVYEATSKFMERDAEYKRGLRQALLTPAATVVAMIAACLYYIMAIFPATAELFRKFDMQVPPMTAGTIAFSDFLAANWWWILLIIVIPILIIYLWWRTPGGRVWRDKFLIGLPIIGNLLHKQSIEIFFRIFSAIYSGAESNIETVRLSAEGCRNAYIEKGIKTITIPLMLKEGMALVPALERANVFTRTALSQLRTGEATGNVLQSASQIARLYEEETTYKMTNVIQSIQTIIAVFITLVIVLLTVVSAEIAFISPPTMGT